MSQQIKRKGCGSAFFSLSPSLSLPLSLSLSLSFSLSLCSILVFDPKYYNMMEGLDIAADAITIGF
jgi:hypothetical protein